MIKKAEPFGYTNELAGTPKQYVLLKDIIAERKEWQAEIDKEKALREEEKKRADEFEGRFIESEKRLEEIPDYLHIRHLMHKDGLGIGFDKDEYGTVYPVLINKRAENAEVKLKETAKELERIADKHYPNKMHSDVYCELNKLAKELRK